VEGEDEDEDVFDYMYANKKVERMDTVRVVSGFVGIYF